MHHKKNENDNFVSSKHVKITTMKLQEVIDYLNATLMPYYQEDYDNSGFLLGDPQREYTGSLVALDLTPDVIEEAIDKGLNFIVTHHPFLFGKGTRRITTRNETGRMIYRLIENGIAVYAAHTNLDNLRWGVSGILAEKLGVKNCRVLQPKRQLLCKLVTFCPEKQADKVRQALHDAGAGKIGNYSHCSYNMEGEGRFRPEEGSHPFVGKQGEVHREPETRIEVIFEKRLEHKIVEQLLKHHPYEEPAYDILTLENEYPEVGGGVVGELEAAMSTEDFLQMVKQVTGLPVVRCSHLCKPKVQRVALCGGSGSFLIGDAKSAGADIFLTGDLKYHDFQQAEEEIILCDIGHYESEQFAKEIIYRIISEKFCTFACQISDRKHGYVNYI